MSGVVTDNCFHQGDRPQQDLANHLSRLDAYRLHAVDAEQDQTSDTAAQNLVIHSQTSYIFSQARRTQDLKLVVEERSLLLSSLLYTGFEIKSIAENVKQIKAFSEMLYLSLK